VYVDVYCVNLFDAVTVIFWCWRIRSLKAEPRTRPLVADFSPRKSGFDPRPIYVGLVLDKGALRRVSILLALFNFSRQEHCTILPYLYFIHLKPTPFMSSCI